ncbi:hypothetical protein RND71_043410 [Anisodus tanguticus]|uniref:TFIIB-type domain-containing protein n=1 Tax=Anisodus tanguticus TaxID=243964 RepID=A0AAE1QP23_9SOLA|nr:hypothetical protein RND71_043410 [Anisodus tanguticus]
MSSNSTCHNCGSSEFETDPARGDTVCTKCGIVIEDNAIVNEIQFEEGNFGGTHVVGQRVTDEYSMRSLSVGGLLGSGGKQSRVITLVKQSLLNENTDTKKDEIKDQKVDNHDKNNFVAEEEDEDLDEEDDDDDYFNLEKERNQLSIANLMSDNFQSSNYEVEEEYDYDYD